MTKLLTLRLRISSLLGLALMLWAAALPVLAQSSGGCSGTACLQNPLRFTSITQAVQGFLQAIVMIALPVITLFIVYAGFKYIMARGNSGKITEAHRNFGWVIIGAALILSAWVLATLIGGTISQLLPGSGGGSAVPLR